MCCPPPYVIENGKVVLLSEKKREESWTEEIERLRSEIAERQSRLDYLMVGPRRVTCGSEATYGYMVWIDPIGSPPPHVIPVSG
jgi:hypothetical protein